MDRFAFVISLFSAVAALSSAAQADVQKGLEALNVGDFETAALEFKAGFDAKDGDAAFYLGRMFELGLGTEVNLQQAIELYEVSVSQNSAPGQNRLGLLFIDGQAVLRDYERGSELVCASADQGDPNGQFNCGIVYKNGQGVAQNDAKAVEYWQASAEQNNIASTNMLGLALKSGEGVETDKVKAFEMFEKTAGQGNALGLFELALALAAGEGVEQNLVEAYKWSNLATALQHPDAPALRDQIEGELSSSQVNEGQKAAREWMDALQASVPEANAPAVSE